MGFRSLDIVVLVRDLPEHGLRRGDVGTVVHVHAPDACEVEFVRASGRTRTLLALTDSDLRAAEDRDLISVRIL